ncbi:URC4/urg3 family protein [Gordonia sp. ABSL1-1]|uniref:URC4/urg3 family protein n=1 Tax=Gordonia sp. ABSL1-1 TaxID=3053923 RepID=UPI002572E8CF|nr:URC4/urg3 family protein [Gordonia sp. ABSL1-1]MDL9938817.1 URC4/urg3 family protein [Gordonia sp. ABSL1-1]
MRIEMPTPPPGVADAVAELRTTAAIRTRARSLLARARAGESSWFTVADDAMGTAAQQVATTTVRRYPSLEIPFHSRWRHFEAGGVHRLDQLTSAPAQADPAERTRSLIDVAVVSVLLDAGAGPEWRYREPDTGLTFARSEGLGVASWHACGAGLFSGAPQPRWRVDADGLAALTHERLAHAFDVGPGNRLVGLDGRLGLLRNLGTALRARPDLFGEDARPGRIYDHLGAGTDTITAHEILDVILAGFASIWPSPTRLDGVGLGDCWPHPAVTGAGLTNGWMPFHKLSQWLTYSLLEPFEWSGITVDGLDSLTALPEYRNGGLLLDTGVLRLRDDAWHARTWRAGDELVVEWRALTVALVDELAELVRDHLGVTATQLPLACVLEGGTWAAGRELAQQLRNGLPPLTILADGTVF